MKRLSVVILLLAAFVGAQAKESAERWFRPVNVTKNQEHKDAVEGKDTIRFFKGEWLETTEKGKGDILLGGEVLPLDAQKIGDHKNRTSDSLHYPLGLKYSAVDSIITVSYNGTDTIPCMVIIQSRNELFKKDWAVPGKITIAGLDSLDVLRFAPKDRASEVVEVASIEGYGKPAETITPDAPEPKPNNTMLYIYIGAGVLALLIIVGIIWFVVARKKRKTPPTEEGNFDNGEQDLPVQTQANVDGKSAEEKRLEQQILQLKSQHDIEVKNLKESIAQKEQEITTIKVTLENRYKEEIITLKEQKEAAEAQAAEERAAILQQSAEERAAILQQFAEEKKGYEVKIEALNTDLANTATELNETAAKLHSTETSLNEATEANNNLNNRLELYNNILSDVPFAKEYASSVGKLVALANEVNDSALKMLELDVEDPYNLMKYISRYAKTVASIDMQTLMTELRMLERGSMVLVGSTLATYNKSNSEEDLKSSTCQYFFSSYLESLVDGLVVLNECMAASDRLVDGVTREDVRVFADYRARIQNACNELGIEVENVCLFDKMGAKIDLSVQLVDLGFEAGDILDMENVIVYLKGSRRPDVKIRVKAQD